MRIKSLGWKTEIKIRSFSGKVLERKGYLAIHTPTNPEFHWGNFLFLPRAPELREIPAWRERFALEFPNIRHMALSWDGSIPEARHQAFSKLGFTIDSSVSLKRDKPMTASPSLMIKTITAKKDWERIAYNYLESGSRQTQERQAFIRNLFNDFRKMAGKGFIRFFGAYINKQLVASLGIADCGGLGRFQEVFIHKNFRRRGIASELIRQASNTALNEMKVKQLVIVADQNSPAEKLYRKLGFTLSGREQGIVLKNVKDSPIR